MKWWIALIALLGLAAGALFLMWKPELPVQVAFRKGLFKDSLVAEFHNTSAKTFAIKARYESATLGQAKDDVLNLSPYDKTARGWLEDWGFRSGDTIELRHADYRIKTVKVP